MRGQFDIARLSPHPFSFHFDSFLAVTHNVMENAWRLDLVRPGRVSMENDTTVLEVLVGQRAPLLLSDGSGPWCSFGGCFGLQSVQE